MSSRTGNPANSGTPLTNPVLVGTTIVVALLVGVFLSYNANKGLPFVTTFPLNAKVPDAAAARQELRGPHRRLPGRPGRRHRRPAGRGRHAAVRAAEDEARRGRQQDPGRHPRAGPAAVAARREVRRADPGRRPARTSRPTRRCRCATPAPRPSSTRSSTPSTSRTRKGLQGAIRGFGDSWPRAGRTSTAPRRRQRADGPAPARRQAARRPTAPTSTASSRAPRSSPARWRRWPASWATCSTRAPSRSQAIDAAGPAFGEGFAELPPTEAVGLKTLNDISPVLRDLADITGAARGTRELPRTTTQLSGALRSGTRVLKRTPEFTEPLNTALACSAP